MARKKKEPIIVVNSSTGYVTLDNKPADSAAVSIIEMRDRMRASFEAFATYQGSSDAEARSSFQELMADVPDFGVGQLSVTMCAQLIAAERWLAGEVKADLPGDEDFQFDDPRLVAALKQEIDRIQKTIINAIIRGELAPERIRRDFVTDAIVAERTFLGYDELLAWLETREFKFGEFFESYVDREEQLRSALLHDLYNMRVVFAGGDSATVEERWSQFLVNRSPMLEDGQGDLESRSREQLMSMIEQALAEIARLRSDMARTPLATIEKTFAGKSRTSHQKVIAALCLQVGVDPKRRDAVGTLEAITRRAGVGVSDDVLRDILKALPDVKQDPKPI